MCNFLKLTIHFQRLKGLYGDISDFKFNLFLAGLEDLDLDGASTWGLGSGKSSGIDETVLGLDDEELLAFDMVDLGPIQRESAEDVVHFDVQSVAVKALDLTGDAIAILHEEEVALIAGEHRYSNQKGQP